MSTVEYRRLGRTDLLVSAVGLGGNTFGPPRVDEPGAVAVIRAALDMGVNFIDTAIVYGQGESERFVGAAIAGRRDDVLIATKFNLRGFDGDLDAHVTSQTDQSLRKLGTDRIDLLQIHAPTHEVSPLEIQTAIAGVIDAGKVRYGGVCNYSSWRLCEAALMSDRTGIPRPVSLQNYYNILSRDAEREVMQFCEREEIAFLPYHPLAGGFLTGKYHPGSPAPDGSRGAAGSNIIDTVSTQQGWRTLEALRTWAADHRISMVELAIAWLLARPGVTSVIAGVSNTAQLEQNVAAADVALSQAQLQEIDEIVGRPLSPERPPYAIGDKP